MVANLAELGGFFLVLVGLGLVIGAAAMVSVALAVLVAGLLATFAGVSVVYVTYIASRPKAAERP